MNKPRWKLVNENYAVLTIGVIEKSYLLVVQGNNQDDCKIKIDDNEISIAEIREFIKKENRCQCDECKTKIHSSSCAVHNEPALPKGECNC